MSETELIEEEISAAEKLRANGEYEIALGLTQDMLSRVHDAGLKIRLWLNVLYCSTRLGAVQITEGAIQELERLPEPETSRVFVDLIQAQSFTDLGMANEALPLIEENLNREVIEREDFQIWKYRYLVCKGRALTWLARCDEALNAFKRAHEIYLRGDLETDILIAQSNCLSSLCKYDEAYDAARSVLNRDDSEMAALALQYMAEIRTWQNRIPEALEIYVELKKRLPSRLVKEDRLKEGMDHCVALVEKYRPQGKLN